jgi:molybdopterin-guanine dinucleotide biosynthesis protein A
VLGVVLAGGKSSRFGADKATAVLCGETLLSRVCRRAAPQATALLINRNVGDHPLQYQLLPDEFPGQGPLAGVLAGLARASFENLSFLATFACDAPFFPDDTVDRLWHGLRRTGADYCVAQRGRVEHYAIALWHVRCRESLYAAFSGGLRSLHGVSNTLSKAVAEFPISGEGPGGDAFFNINTPEDLACAERWSASY